MRRQIILTAILSSFALGSCGVKGELKTPPPLWGDKEKTEQSEDGKSEGQTDNTTPSGSDTA